jgi:hypothetical protein
MRSVKTQALIDIGAVVLVAAGSSIAFLVATKLFGIANVLTFGGFALMAVCFYQLFKLRCDQIEYQRKLTEMVDKTK